MPGPTPLRAVLFDFGGVVVDSPFRAFTAYETSADLRPGLLRAINSADPDTNAWARLERGEIDGDEFASRFARESAALGARVDGAAVLGLLLALGAGVQHARPQMLAAVERCRGAGLSTGLLTNNVRPMRDSGGGWVFDRFDAVLESCLLGVRKPEPAIYALACARLGTDAGHTALLDDLGINLKPARALGMHTIKVVDPHDAVAELDALLTYGAR